MQTYHTHSYHTHAQYTDSMHKHTDTTYIHTYNTHLNTVYHHPHTHIPHTLTQDGLDIFLFPLIYTQYILKHLIWYKISKSLSQARTTIMTTDLRINCAPNGLGFWTLYLQLLILFGRVVESLGAEPCGRMWVTGTGLRYYRPAPQILLCFLTMNIMHPNYSCVVSNYEQLPLATVSCPS